MTPQADPRYVYGACCTWHGPIQEIKVVGGPMTVNGRAVNASLPACPHCLGPLMEYPTRAVWDESIAKFKGDHPELPLYGEWMESLRTAHCVPLEGWDWRAAYAKFAGAIQ